MENNIRFRNHISVVFEKSVRLVGLIVFMFIGSFLSDIASMKSSQIGLEILILMAVIIACMVAAIAWQLVIWSRTYISIQENTLVVERNTLNRKKQTIGIKNISNVNLEQNLFQMLLGTSRVKIDTNSLSTANATDVNIVLKKRDAEAFRMFLLGKEEKQIMEEEHMAPAQKRRLVSDLDDIIMHGFFSISLSSLVGFLVIAGFLIFALTDMIKTGEMESIMEVIVSIFMAVWALGGMAWNIAKGFIKYADFQIERKENKISLSYGILKKVAYSIPVDKINAVRFTQTPLARMGKRYMVEVINVGMDDDETEAYAFFLPYAKAEKIKEQINMLLPEFEGCLDIKEEKQPRCIWLIWIPKVILYLVIAVAGVGILGEFVQDALAPAIIGTAIISIMLVIAKIAGYLTAGCAVDGRFLNIVSGCFGRRRLFIKYDKVQFVVTNQNVIAKHFQVQKGSIHILASIKNQVHTIPYFREKEVEKLKNYILK